MVKKITISAFVLLSMTLAFFAGAFYGQNGVAAEPNSGENVAISQADYEEFMSYRRLSQIQDLIDEIYLGEYDSVDLLTGAAKGMVYALGDPYADYFTPEEVTEQRISMEGNYAGIGVQVFLNESDSLVTVTNVFLESPALEAGVLIGDKIIAVDGEDVRGQSLDDVVAKVKGEIGTEVTLTLFRDSAAVDISLKRAEIVANRITRRMIDDIGYIKIESFSGDDVKGFKDAVAFIESQKAKGLIIDLRNNGGGLVSDVVEIADVLLPQGIVFYTEDKYGSRSESLSDPKHLGLPLVVLVNEYSASASEILAGAIQDYGIGKLVGVKTFGKGIVQTQVPFKEDGAALKLTTDYYYTPNGRCIHGEGLEPDYIAENSEYAIKNPYLLNDADDDQLQKALSVLGDLINK